MCNCDSIFERLGKRCRGSGGICSKTGTQHIVCSGRTARQAAKYPFEMCEAILRGLRDHVNGQGRLQPSLNAVLPRAEAETCFEDPVLLAISDGDVYDATTGQVLKGDLVSRARAEEMKYFLDKDVWTKRPRQEAFDRTGKGDDDQSN